MQAACVHSCVIIIIRPTHHAWFDFNVKHNSNTARSYLVLHIKLAVFHSPRGVREVERFSTPVIESTNSHTSQALSKH